MVDIAQIQPGQRVLEPSAGTGNIVSAIINRGFLGFECGGTLVTVEINPALADGLRQQCQRTLYATDSNYDIRCADFLQCNGDLGTFHSILMNPPFNNGADIQHIQHALTMLKPGGHLVAICANGPRQQETLRPQIEQLGGTWEPLPSDTFKASGTTVNTALLSVCI